MATPPKIERCDGAKSNTPEAALCRLCKRAEAGKGRRQFQQSFVSPMVRMSRHFELGAVCEFHIPAESR